MAKSLTRIEKERIEGLNRDSSYAEILAFHKTDAEKAEGWRAIATPSERYVIKTNSDNNKFLKEVIERVEASRDLFEAEYPPETPLTHVSVVRVFDKAEALVEKSRARAEALADEVEPDELRQLLYFFVDTVLSADEAPPQPDPSVLVSLPVTSGA